MEGCNSLRTVVSWGRGVIVLVGQGGAVIGIVIDGGSHRRRRQFRFETEMVADDGQTGCLVW